MKRKKREKGAKMNVIGINNNASFMNLKTFNMGCGVNGKNRLNYRKHRFLSQLSYIYNVTNTLIIPFYSNIP